ncbi:MAG: molecular chaperone, partial [Candidatus Methylomirabilota bacterium]
GNSSQKLDRHPTSDIRHPTSDEVDIALCRSILYEALALGFRPPTAETVERLVSPTAVQALADAVAVLDSAWSTSLATLVHRFSDWPVPPSLDSLQVLYRRLFGHTARGGVPPYETEYGEDSLFQPSQEMSDLAGFYRAFGLVIRPSEHERIDHISCECEFMLFLARKEAYALVQNNTSMLEDTRSATRLFLRHHLGRWAPAFGRRLARQDPDGFYGGVGELLVAFVTQECAQCGVPAGPELMRLRSTSLGNVPMACGPADELLQTESSAPAERHDAMTNDR